MSRNSLPSSTQMPTVKRTTKSNDSKIRVLIFQTLLEPWPKNIPGFPACFFTFDKFSPFSYSYIDIFFLLFLLACSFRKC
jgi:hypothetical protein